MNKNKKINQEEDVVEFQPSLDFLAHQTNANELSEEEYKLLKNELESYFGRSKSFYELPKNNENLDWERPHITRSKEELFAQLKYYDILREKEKLSERQLEEINKEIIQIKKELLTIANYEYFLKTGHEQLQIDKTDFGKYSVKFYQREDLYYDDLARKHVSIDLPLEKWWIKNNIDSLGYFDEDHELPYEFVHIKPSNNSDVKQTNEKSNGDNVLPIKQSATVFEAVEKEKQLDKILSDPEPEVKQGFWSHLFKKNKDEKSNKEANLKDKNKKEVLDTSAKKPTNGKSTPPSSPQPTSRFTPPPPPSMPINGARGFNNFPPPSPNSFANSLKQGPTPTSTFPSRPPIQPGQFPNRINNVQPNQNNNNQDALTQRKQFFDYQQQR